MGIVAESAQAMQLILRVIPEENGPYARLWLITKDRALSGAAYGVAFKERAEFIAQEMEKAGFKVERGVPSPDTEAEPHAKTTYEKQSSLFRGDAMKCEGCGLEVKPTGIACGCPPVKNLQICVRTK